jgi:hypothetical protein
MQTFTTDSYYLTEQDEAVVVRRLGLERRESLSGRGATHPRTAAGQARPRARGHRRAPASIHAPQPSEYSLLV